MLELKNSPFPIPHSTFPIRSLAFSFLIFTLLLCNCDLFNNPKDPHFLEKIDAEIAWANAAKLTVRIAATPWGISNPVAGSIDSSKTRKGFPFTVEFGLDSAYVFVEWLAIPLEIYENFEENRISLGEMLVKALTEPTAVISGGRTASVTLNTTAKTVLLPYCVDRPRITQSNPPLLDAGISYNRSQQIKIWFDAELDVSTVIFGSGFIEINGQTIGANSELYNDPETPENENGDLTGSLKPGTAQFFKNPVFDAASKTIIILPGDGGSDGTKLPPGDIVITVNVGTKLLGINGNGMIAARSFYYRTNTLEVKDKYVAENIWAIHKPDETPFSEGNFIYEGADTRRDWRFRKNGTGDYVLSLYFNVRAIGAEMTDLPTHCAVKEFRAFNITGGGTSGSFTYIDKS